MLEKLSQEKLVATVVGWDCCCDIDLSLTKGGWLGSGFSKKDRGLRVELHLSKTNESLKLAVYLQSEKKSFEAVVPGFQTGGMIGFCIDANGFFGSPQEKDGTDRNLVRILLGGHQALKGQFRNYAFGLSY